MRLLVVEDNPADVRLFKLACGDFAKNSEMQVVSDGEAALDYLHRRKAFVNAPRPDLILLDLNLPKILGLEVLRDIKATSELKKIPVIILSSTNRKTYIEEAYESGAACFLKKPADLTDFQTMCTSLADFWGRIAILPSAKGVL